MNGRNWLIAGGALGVLLGVPKVRRATLSKGIMNGMKSLGFLPKISETEKTAIEAGTVWVDGELFSGKPNFQRLLNEAYPDLTEEEQAFLDGPVEEICEMVTDWEIWQRRDLPPRVWEYLKKNKFFGMIIPKEYGGLGFSASANSAVVTKLSGRSQVLGTTVMVPNSLGPAELLIHYGTQEQRDHYLPHLAVGEDIPSFALTEPTAGSDAGAMQSTGVVFRDDDGEIKLRLNWKKRYITLAAVSTVLGLAFKMKDPDNLLGTGENLGITCALIPTDTKGVVLGRRHDPMGVPFYNSPTEGHDVVLPLDVIIGGVGGAGQGWRMLMESLAAGRGISLPASSTAGAKSVYRVASAHAAIRKQFGLSIGKFEGIEEPLARIGGFTYIIEAARRYTNGGIDQGAKPAVVTAMMKYNTTEMARTIMNDGMDILAGNSISRGPRNALAHGYIGQPIAITVEGANILTRTLMVFGQGAIRCHPYALKEIEALEDNNLVAFDKAFWGHIVHVLRNFARSIYLSVSRGNLAQSPVSGPAAPYYRKLAWTSASFAFLADLAMGSLGGNLKRKEKITGRFADIFSWMYLANATLTRFEKEGRLKEDLPFFQWSMEYAFARMQEGFDGLYENLNVPAANLLLRGPIALWSRMNPLGTGPSDYLGHKVAQAMQIPGEQRDRHTVGLYVSEDRDDPLGRLEYALKLHHAAEGIERTLRDAVKAGSLPKAAPAQIVAKAVDLGLITQEDAALVRAAEEARTEAIQVDSFTLEEYLQQAVFPDAEPGIEPTQETPAEVEMA
ncbi:MAG TPA: acyl-CoA dehydrogenase [Rhodothermales bacterium]|nr:acyl-CoA dehydrogenase [Rhodothermales bacterium]